MCIGISALPRFELALFFSRGAGPNIGISLCIKRVCGDFGELGIGFVLRDWPTTAENAEIAERTGWRKDGQDREGAWFGPVRID